MGSGTNTKKIFSFLLVYYDELGLLTVNSYLPLHRKFVGFNKKYVNFTDRDYSSDI